VGISRLLKGTPRVIPDIEDLVAENVESFGAQESAFRWFSGCQAQAV
jgi:hypothetical protein